MAILDHFGGILRHLYPGGIPKFQTGSDSGSDCARHSRDPRPVGDRAFTAQCAKNVVELLTVRGPQMCHAVGLQGTGNRQNWGIHTLVFWGSCGVEVMQHGFNMKP